MDEDFTAFLAEFRGTALSKVCVRRGTVSLEFGFNRIDINSDFVIELNGRRNKVKWPFGGQIALSKVLGALDEPLVGVETVWGDHATISIGTMNLVVQFRFPGECVLAYIGSDPYPSPIFLL